MPIPCQSCFPLSLHSSSLFPNSDDMHRYWVCPLCSAAKGEGKILSWFQMLIANKGTGELRLALNVWQDLMKFTTQIKGPSYNTVPSYYIYLKYFTCLFSFAALTRLHVTLGGTSGSLLKQMSEKIPRKNKPSVVLYKVAKILLIAMYLQPRCINQRHLK